MMQDKIEEFKSLMEAGLDEVATGDNEIAEEYFSDAAAVLKSIDDQETQKKLEQMYTINPLDFAV